MPWQWITLPTSPQLPQALQHYQGGTYLTFLLPPVIELHIGAGGKKELKLASI